MVGHNNTEKQKRRFIVNDNSSKNFEPHILSARSWQTARFEAENWIQAGYYNAKEIGKDQYIPYSVYSIPADHIVDNKVVDYSTIDDSLWQREDFTYTESCTFQCALEDIFQFEK